MNQFLWKIGGEAGFGILTTGTVFSKIASRQGYFIFDYIQYPSLVRGGHNTYDVVFSAQPVTALKQDIDMLVCLNKDTYELHKDRLNPTSIILFDRDEFEVVDEHIKIEIPFKKILSELKGQVLMKNTIALGASLALLGTDLKELNSLLETQFGKKGSEVVQFNKTFAQAGYDHIKKNYPSHIRPHLIKRENDQQLVISGNETFSLGAAGADCGLYAAYPMTPASSVLTVLAAWQNKTNMVVRHAEDEIAVINTALGASIAGTRAAVGTSGGGFALMVESLSFAGVAEIPIVVFIAQRPGPATGMPTWTEQGDLLFAVNGGHGEFPKIVLAPGDNEEMLELTVKAFDLADIYQTPVIILSDMLLSESHRSLSRRFVDKIMKDYIPKRGKLIKQLEESTQYKRYLVTDDGISPRLIPGVQGAFYQSNSYEHLEDGHTTEEASERIKQADKRARKTSTYLEKDFEGPRVYGELDTADTILVSWGSTKGVLLEAQRDLVMQGHNTAVLHFHHVFPLNKKVVLQFLNKKKRYILVENNSHAQFGTLLTAETGIIIEEKILKYDGRPIFKEEIIGAILK